MQNLYDIDKSTNVVDGLIYYYKNRMITDSLDFHQDIPIIGKIHTNGSFEHYTCGHAVQTIIRNNLDLFMSPDSIEGITFGEYDEKAAIGKIGFVHKSYIYGDVEAIQPLSVDYNILESMLKSGNMFAVYDWMQIIYRPNKSNEHTEPFEKIVGKLNEDPIVLNEGTKTNIFKLHSIIVNMTNDSMQIKFLHK